jgi:uncharacterized delta-60 repeat protein
MKHIFTSLLVLEMLAGCSSDPTPPAGDPVEESSGSQELTIAATTPGSLDLTFGQWARACPRCRLIRTGKATTAIGGMFANALAIATLTDGKMVVAGQSAKGFALARYNINGDLDTTFGSGGKIVNSPAQHLNSGRALGIQTDGKIVLGGSIWTGYSYDFALLRYNTNGSVDTTFGSGGVVQNNWVPSPLPPGGFYRLYGGGVESLAFQPDGKIVVAGTYFANPSGGPVQESFAVVRYNANGSLDTGFGTGGITTTTTYPGYKSTAKSMVLQSDGKIVVAGYDMPPDDSTSDMAVVRYNANGTYDTSFDIDGIARVGFLGYSRDYANAIKIQSDGKIVLAGQTDAIAQENFALARLNTNGSLDTSFDDDGLAITSIGKRQDSATSLGIQTDGKIVAGGVSFGYQTEKDFAMVRYNPDGSLDTGFGVNGRVTTVFGPRIDSANALDIQSNGKIVLAGCSFSDPQTVFALARYNP